MAQQTADRIIVPKGDTRPLEPTLAEKRAMIFALPVPAAPATKRTYPIHTMTGRLMRLQRITVMEMCGRPGMPRHRRMTEILAGREPVGQYRQVIARALGVDAELL